MTDFINTRTEMGETVALNALIANTLTQLNEDALVELADYGLYRHTQLQTVNFPNLTKIGYDGFAYCTNMKTVDIGVTCTLESRAFMGSHIEALILRGNGICTMRQTNVIPDYFRNGMSRIYVPNDLVEAYKSASNWCNFSDYICSIDDYPITELGTITDSWEDIFESENDGTYKTKYGIGDTKTLYWDNGKVNMQIVAFDADDLFDVSGKAKITWICENIYAMTDYNTALPVLPTLVNDNIKPVLKYTRQYNGSEAGTEMRYWRPSAREVGLPGNSYTVSENSGVQYNEIFSDNKSRVKVFNGDNAGWFLRTRSGRFSTYYSYVSSGGTYGEEYYTHSNGQVFGFCT